MGCAWRRSWMGFVWLALVDVPAEVSEVLVGVEGFGSAAAGCSGYDPVGNDFSYDSYDGY